MKKIAQVIDEIVSDQAFLEDGIAHGYINYTAFAEFIKPFVESETKKDVSIHAIKMALSRKKSFVADMNHRLRRRVFASVNSQSGLSIITLVRSPKSIDLVTGYMAEKRKDGHFFTVIEGVHEIDIIFETVRHRIEENIPSALKLCHLSGLSLISCQLSDLEISTPGLFYTVTKQLAFHNINIIQVLSTYHELGIILLEKDLKKAIQVLIL